MEYKRNVITPIFTHLCTLQKLEDLYIGTSVKEPGDNFLRQLNFKAKIARFHAYNGLCVLFAERRSRRLISCPDGEPGKNVYNLDGESRRSRLGSCF